MVGRTMAKVNWRAGIDSVSGALSKPSKSGQHSCAKMLLGTHRVAATTSSDCNKLYLRKKTVRSTPVTTEEMNRRVRFATVAQAVATRKKDLSKISQDQINFMAQRDQANGYKTMKSYLWSLELASYDAEHQEILGDDERPVSQHVQEEQDKAEGGYHHLRVDVRQERQVEGEDEQAYDYSRQYDKYGLSHKNLSE